MSRDFVEVRAAYAEALSAFAERGLTDSWISRLLVCSFGGQGLKED